MTIRRILTVFTPGYTNEADLRSAAYLGRQFEAQIVGLHARPDPFQVVSTGASSWAIIAQGETIIDVVRIAGEESASAARAVFERICEDESLDVTDSVEARQPGAALWKDRVGEVDSIVASEASLADLTLFSVSTDQSSSEGARLATAALLRSGRPVLLVPERFEISAGIGQSILVAWNGSPEANRALWFALPFLKRAEKVSIIRFGEAALGLTAPDDLIAPLAAHGVAAHAQTIEVKESLEDSLIEAIQASRSDLLVMGGYTHSRLRELVFGGLTRYAVSSGKLPIPVLLAH